MPKLPKKIGRYQILEKIGGGGMGVVYKARDPNIGRLVALKVIKLSLDNGSEESKEIRERFRREAATAGVLQHNNIVTVYDAGDDKGTPYLAMEYVEGETLDRLAEPGETLPIEKVNSIIRQVAEGLDYAHQKGVVHRDIKPANILVTKDGAAKIMDFGIARLSDSELTQRGVVMGSPSYMSPEQVTGKEVDGRSDLFSLGVVLYQLLTGDLPFPGENPTAISYRVVSEDPPSPSMVNPVVEPGYNYVVSKAMAKNPSDRYQSGREMARDLERVARGKRPGAKDATPPVGGARRVMWKTWRSRSFRWSAAGTVLIGLAVVLVIISLRISNPYNDVRELIKAGQHERAVWSLLRLKASKPKDHRAVYLLGREYSELGDHHSSILAYTRALVLRPDYRYDEKLQQDLVKALSSNEADAAIQLIVTKVGGPIVPKLEKALKDPGYATHWNAAEALTGLGEEVDELPLLVLDLKYNPDCTKRRAAAARMGELGDPRALPELELAMGDRRNTRSCMGMTLERAKEKINEKNPDTEH